MKLLASLIIPTPSDCHQLTLLQYPVGPNHLFAINDYLFHVLRPALRGSVHPSKQGVPDQQPGCLVSEERRRTSWRPQTRHSLLQWPNVRHV